jgi:predicted MFS family arabinose efflux permease
LLVLSVVMVTFSFGIGQPALMRVVGEAASPDVRGVALGLATLVFLVGGGLGSGLVGGLSRPVGMAGSLAILVAFPVLGLLGLLNLLRRAPSPS